MTFTDVRLIIRILLFFLVAGWSVYVLYKNHLRPSMRIALSIVAIAYAVIGGSAIAQYMGVLNDTEYLAFIQPFAYFRETGVVLLLYLYRKEQREHYDLNRAILSPSNNHLPD